MHLGQADVGLGSSSATRWWLASAISSPPPSAAPLIAATTGLPSVSRVRSCALISCAQAVSSSASSASRLIRSWRSPPAKNVFFADVRTTPVMLSFSPRRAGPTARPSTRRTPRSSCSPTASGSSSVRVTMPSASLSQRIVFVLVHCSLEFAQCSSDRSTMVAMPMPPPTHSVHEARRASAALELVERGAEQHRAGRAERMAQGDRAAVHVDRSRVDVQVAHEAAARTAANASLISKRSMSLDCHAGASRAPSGLAGVGAVSMIVGSAPETRRRDDPRARLQAERFVPDSSEPMSTSAAPSTMPDELPAVWTCSIFSTSVVLLQRDGVEAAHARPSAANDALEPAEPFERGVGPRCTRRGRARPTPLRSLTGTTALGEAPFAPARAARLLRLRARTCRRRRG